MVRHQQIPRLGQANVPELRVRAFDRAGNRNLLFDVARRGVDDHRLGRIAVAHDQDPIRADGLAGVNFRSRRRGIIP